MQRDVLKNNKIKVLLLEDDPYYLELYSNRLRGSDFDVAVEADEDEGLKRAEQHNPDVIVLDISLPKNDDFSFVEKLKKNSKTSTIPVVILTDLDDEYSKKKGLSMGAVNYLLRDNGGFSEAIKIIKNHKKK